MLPSSGAAQFDRQRAEQGVAGLLEQHGRLVEAEAAPADLGRCLRGPHAGRPGQGLQLHPQVVGDAVAERLLLPGHDLCRDEVGEPSAVLLDGGTDGEVKGHSRTLPIGHVCRAGARMTRCPTPRPPPSRAPRPAQDATPACCAAGPSTRPPCGHGHHQPHQRLLLRGQPARRPRLGPAGPGRRGGGRRGHRRRRRRARRAAGRGRRCRRRRSTASSPSWPTPARPTPTSSSASTPGAPRWRSRPGGTASTWSTTPGPATTPSSCTSPRRSAPGWSARTPVASRRAPTRSR